MRRDFPPVYWAAWDADATFAAGEQLPPESQGRLWAVLGFIYYGDKIALADITGRGLCIPSGRIEPGETVDEALVREAWEETGVRLDPERRRLIGCYRLIPRTGSQAGRVRFCPVFVAEAWGFEPVPTDSESRGLILAATEDVSEIYFTWDELMAAVFAYADERRTALFPAGVPVFALKQCRQHPLQLPVAEIADDTLFHPCLTPKQDALAGMFRSGGSSDRRVGRLEDRQHVDAIDVAQFDDLAVPLVGHGPCLEMEAVRHVSGCGNGKARL